MAVQLQDFHALYAVPIAMGLTEWLKRVGVWSKLLPLCCITLTAVGDLLIAKFTGQPITGLTFLAGIVAGFTAVGFYSGGKNTWEMTDRGAG